MKINRSNPQTDKVKSTLFFSGILAIIIAILWIGISVYSAYTNHQPDKDMDRLLTPINPTLDSQVLEQYQQSRIIPPQEFNITVVKKVGRETSTYSLNPFTNITNEINPLPTSPTTSTASAATSTTP